MNSQLIREISVFSVCLFLILLLILISVHKVNAQQTRSITFVNNCDETIWVGSLTNQISGGWQLNESCSQDSDCMTACTNAETAGFSSDDCTASCVNGKCEVDLEFPFNNNIADNLSGRFWPMTGCDFNSSFECGSGRCCDTGGCDTASGFGLQCNTSGDAPTTVAEFTLQSGADNDFYDISVIDGFNVPVEMKPVGKVSSPPDNFDSTYWCGNPGGVASTSGTAVCTWQTVLGDDCAGNHDFRAVGSLQTCESDSDCGSGKCNQGAGICECSGDSDCNRSGDICGVTNPGFIGSLACGKPVGCITAKVLCGVGQYFEGGVKGESCGQKQSCASGNCLTMPAESCSVTSDCADGAVCREGQCQCIPNVCNANGVCTNDGASCNTTSDCTPTCAGICSESPVDFLECNSTDLENKVVSCEQDSDCPALVGLPGQCNNSNCPENTTCVDFGAAPQPGQNTPSSKVCRTTCVNNICMGPPCETDSDCFDSLSGTFMTCDKDTGSQTHNTCVSTNASLFQGAGVNGQSCYIPYYDDQVNPSAACNGCPTACNDDCNPPQSANSIWPPPVTGESCRNTNSDWVGKVEPLIEGFKKACPSAYSFPFDDTTSTYQCNNDITSNTTSYQITFCPSKENDQDGDGVDNDMDLDSDNDGITDSNEVSFDPGSSQNNLKLELNHSADDIDGDGISNELDLDSDGDCIPDHIEAGGSIDGNRDGLVDNFTDSDNNGHHDDIQTGNGLTPQDTDGDGNPDFLDTDSDNDGITDTNETTGSDSDNDGICDDNEDLNLDGLADSVHPLTGTPLNFLDSNGNGIPDHLDSSIGNNGNGCSLTRGDSFKPGMYELLLLFLLSLTPVIRKKLNKAFD